MTARSPGSRRGRTGATTPPVDRGAALVRQRGRSTPSGSGPCSHTCALSLRTSSGGCRPISEASPWACAGSELGATFERLRGANHVTPEDHQDAFARAIHEVAARVAHQHEALVPASEPAAAPGCTDLSALGGGRTGDHAASRATTRAPARIPHGNVAVTLQRSGTRADDERAAARHTVPAVPPDDTGRQEPHAGR